MASGKPSGHGTEIVVDYNFAEKYSFHNNKNP
jgi:hypothetical protein